MERYYQIFYSLPNNRKLFYLSLVIFIFVVVSRSFISLSHILALLVILVIAGWIMAGDATHQEVIHTIEQEKLDFLNSLLYTDSYGTINDEFHIQPPIYGSYLDKDLQIVDFYYRLRDYFNYNLPSFRKSLLNTNTLLGVENFLNHLDYAPKKPREYLEMAEKEYKEALNNMHSLIHSIPSTRITNYTFNNSLQNLEFLLIQHLDNVKNLAKLHFDTCEISQDSQPIHDYHALPNDQKDKGYSMNYSMY